MPKALPKTLGAAADLVFARREARLALQRAQEKELAPLKAAEDEAELHTIALLKAQGLASARGELATVTLQQREVPKIVDIAKFTRWIKRTGDFAFFQQRPSLTHFRELVAAGKTPDGIETVPVDDLSVTRAAR